METVSDEAGQIGRTSGSFPVALSFSSIVTDHSILVRCVAAQNKDYIFQPPLQLDVASKKVTGVMYISSGQCPLRVYPSSSSFLLPVS